MAETWLVTGGAGFIGANFIHYVLSNRSDVHLINLDKLTYAGNLENLDSVAKNSNYHFVKGDITDVNLVQAIFSGKQVATLCPCKVIHFAAESHVDRSINDASPFVITNVLGTQVLLDAAKQAWETNGVYSKDYRFLHVSTDEVFGSLGETGYFTETTPYMPNSPYSASKAGSDMLVRAFVHTHHFPGIITNCSNNYGPYQFPEKLIPLIIHNIIHKKPLPVYGKGQNTRDWLFVKDHCNALLTILEKAALGERYNIGGHNEWKNIDIVQLLCDQVDNQLERKKNSRNLITYVTDRKGHDFRYAIDANKIEKELGWKPMYTFETGIHETITWYLEHQDWLKNVTSGEYQRN